MKILIFVSVKIKIKSITTLNRSNITHNNFLTNQQICLVSAQQDHEVCDGNAYRVVYAPFPPPSHNHLGIGEALVRHRTPLTVTVRRTLANQMRDTLLWFSSPCALIWASIGLAVKNKTRRATSILHSVTSVFCRHRGNTAVNLHKKDRMTTTNTSSLSEGGLSGGLDCLIPAIL